jgi:hypothetical protein
MPGGTWTSGSNFSGDVYATTGPDPTGAFNPNLVTRTRVGTASLAFSSSSQATLAYTINGVSGSRAVVRQSFGIPDTTTATSYGDLWWNASESGWGVSISQQYRTLFAVWYSYAPDGQPVWYVMPGGTWTASGTYTGTLYRTSAAPTPFFGSTRFDAASVTRTAVGTLTFDFTSTSAAIMSYTIDGASGAKAITRQAF